MSSPALVWLRRDLRLDDNPALAAAAARAAIIPVFVWSPHEEAPWAPGAASRVWLHHSLAALRDALRARGLELLITRGDAQQVLVDLAARTGACAVYWNRLYEPALSARDASIEGALRARGLEVLSFAGTLLHEPHTIENRQGRAFRVFTPFHRHCAALGPPRAPVAAALTLTAAPSPSRGLALDALELLPRIDWSGGIRDAWTPGEAGAARELDTFADAAVEHYAQARDQPHLDGVSRLSPHLHFGEITPHRIWHRLARQWPGRGEGSVSVKVEPFTRQLYWREFAHHLLHHFPHTTEQALSAKFRTFSWRSDPPALRAWARGLTGYPLIDAGMRELWHTGWMHNRVRMNVASFLVKHLLIDWREGARWFWDTLVDADLANNTMGWQWAAGCGADAAPYFRIFNPVLQGQRFDARGTYVRRWIPELARLPDAHIHAPWAAPAQVLSDAGVRLGHGYPHPIVEHAAARKLALATLARSNVAKDR